MVTNSLAMRDSENRQISLESQSKRVLLIGDSMIEGLGVDYDDSVAGNLQKIWQATGVEVLNAGVVSYSPHLYSLIGREIGGVDGFGYSEVLATSGEAWTEDNLNGFLEDPKGWAPGTKMNFNGLRKIEDRANLIAYLQTIGS